MTNEQNAAGSSSRQSVFRRLSKQPRIILVLLAAWSILAALNQLFVNSGIFLDIHGAELDGALGGFALSLNAIPLAVVYLYCARRPQRYPNVFWLAFIQQGAIIAAVLYHLGAGTFSAESIIAPLVGSAILAGACFLQAFDPTASSE